MNARALCPSPRVNCGLPVTKLNLYINKNGSPKNLSRVRTSRRWKRSVAWDSPAMSTVYNITYKLDIISPQREEEKNPRLQPRLCRKKVVVYCNSFFFLFFTAHVRDIKIPNRRRVEIERRVSEIDALGCIRTPSGIDHIYIYIYIYVIHYIHMHVLYPANPSRIYCIKLWIILGTTTSGNNKIRVQFGFNLGYESENEKLFRWLWVRISCNWCWET